MLKNLLKGTLRLASGILRLEFIDYKWDISKHKPLLEKIIADNHITDEETADLLDHIADQL